MKPQPISQPKPSATLPQQVWATLNPSQQKTVLQTLVQMCLPAYQPTGPGEER